MGIEMADSKRRLDRFTRHMDTREYDTREYLDRLSSLRSEIASLCVVKCRMAHERVVIAPDSMLPVVWSFPVGAYKRVGLCSPEVRAERLGCSHTMARVKLGAAIAQLENPDEQSATPLSFLKDEFIYIDNEIHLLDHQKGEAEKALARALEEWSGDATGHALSCDKVRNAEQDIRVLERLHDQYVDRIGVLRDRIIGKLDRLIEKTTRELTPQGGRQA